MVRPIANIAPEIWCNAGDTNVTGLSGASSASPTNRTPLTYQWTAVTAGAPALDSYTSATPTIAPTGTSPVPSVANLTYYDYKLVVTDVDGSSSNNSPTLQRLWVMPYGPPDTSGGNSGGTGGYEVQSNKGAPSGYAGLDTAGHIITSQLPQYSRGMVDFRNSRWFAETLSRVGSPMGSLTLTSGQELCMGIELSAGDTVTKIGFKSGNAAAASPTHQWFTLRDSGFNLLAVTSDDLTTAWAANSPKDLLLSAPYLINSDGIYYIGVVITATTLPTLRGITGSAQEMYNETPIVAAISSTSGYTTPGGAATTLTTASTPLQLYGGVS